MRVYDLAGNEGSFSDTIKIVLDTQTPTITIQEPENDTILSTTTPTISAVLADEGTGIDADTIEMKLNDNVVEHSYDTDEGLLSYIPEPPLEDRTTYTVSINAQDKAGNSAIIRATKVAGNQIV